MNDRHRLGCCMLLLLGLILLSGAPAVAGGFSFSTPDDADGKDCNESTGDECSEATGPNGDPTECLWNTAQNGSQHIQCIGEQLEGDGYGVSYGTTDEAVTMNVYLNQGPGGGPPANPGPEDEIFSYCLREAGDLIQDAQIEVDQPNLAAKIHTIVEIPAPFGEIRIQVNDDPVIVDAARAYKSRDRLNKLICDALQANFQADCLDNFFVVYADRQGQTPRSLGVATDVGGVLTMEIALEPTGEPADETACSPPRIEILGAGLISVPR